MKLFIDDIRNAPDTSWTVARSLSAAIRCIHQFGADIETISIDHDISHQVGMGALSRPYPCEETFAAVCYFIGEFYQNKRPFTQKGIGVIPHIILHTSNPIGAVAMKGILEQYDLACEIKMVGAANRLEMEAH